MDIYYQTIAYSEYINWETMSPIIIYVMKQIHL